MDLLNFVNMQFKSNIYNSCLSRDAVGDFLRVFDYPSSNQITHANWPWVTISFLPSSILHSLASRLYCLVFLSLYNACLMDIPGELCRLASLKALDLGGNSFRQIPENIKELRKLHSLRLCDCRNLTSLPELPRSLEILNAHGCVSLKSFPSSYGQFPRRYTFSNCFALSAEAVRNYMGKALNSVEVMTKGHHQVSSISISICLCLFILFFYLSLHALSDALVTYIKASLEQEHSNVPGSSICIPASTGHNSSVDFQAGSSVAIELTPGILKTGFALSVVVEFWENYRNVSGFGIWCICRKTRTDLSRRLNKIFHCWAPKEAPTVRKDHMFVFGFGKRDLAEGIFHDFLADSITFEFYPVDWQNQLLVDSCKVKNCGVAFVIATTCETALSAKRPSSVNQVVLSNEKHMEPQYKRCRLKNDSITLTPVQVNI